MFYHAPLFYLFQIIFYDILHIFPFTITLYMIVLKSHLNVFMVNRSERD